MNFDPTSYRRHELGLLLPPSAAESGDPDAPVAHVGIYLTYSELTEREPLSEDEITGRLSAMSSSDCLLSLAQIGARLYAGGTRTTGGDVQNELVDLVAGDGPLADKLHDMLRDGRWSAIFCEQQLVHLARLVIWHADHRPPDEFVGGELYADWVTCLIAVTDLLDSGLKIEDRDERLAWEIRQCELNHHAEQLPATAVHYELYRRLWPEMLPEGAAVVEEAFRSATGLSIGEFFMVGSAVLARFGTYGHTGDGAPMLQPEVYFSSTTLDPSVWRAFFRVTARDIDGLSTSLHEEEHRYGHTTYGSLTFERYPLVEAQPGLFLPISVASLHRRVTEGVFHVLAEIAEQEGRDRRHYTSTFGDVFQQLVEQTIRRAEAMHASPVPITADVPYGSRKRPRDSSDVILAYERNPLFVEVVSGPLQAATTTRGDAECFRADLQRLVLGKARQLSRCIDDFFAGDLEVAGADPRTTFRAWPVILTSHSFPHAQTIMEVVEAAVRSKGWLQQDRVGDLAIVSMEDLFFCEGFAQRGRNLLSLIRSWKASSESHLPFKNHLVELGGGRAPGSDHFERMYAEASSEWMRTLLGSTVTAEEILAHGRREHDL